MAGLVALSTHVPCLFVCPVQGQGINCIGCSDGVKSEIGPPAINTHVP